MRYDAVRYVIARDYNWQTAYRCPGGVTHNILDAEMFRTEREARDCMQSHGINFEHYEVRPVTLAIETE